MAKETPPEVEEQPEAQPKYLGKKKKLLIIAAVAAVLILAAGSATVYWLISEPVVETPAKAGEEPEAEDEEHPPVYEKLDSFTVNLADGETYLQVEIHLMLADFKIQEKVKLQMPEIRDAIIRLLSSKTAEELSVPEGKDALAVDVQRQVNGLLKIKKASKGVKKVLFNAFIIQ